MDIYEMSTDDVIIMVDIKDRDSLIKAMHFKAKHIKAKTDPAVFGAVAKALENSAEVVRCKDCKHWGRNVVGNCAICSVWGRYSQMAQYCSSGERKEE